MNTDIEVNYRQLKLDTQQIVSAEMKKIKDDPLLQRLIKESKFVCP